MRKKNPTKTAADMTDGDYVKGIRETWMNISLDFLSMLKREEGTDSIDGDLAREVVADYIDLPGWWDLPHEHRDALITEALPEESWCL